MNMRKHNKWVQARGGMISAVHGIAGNIIHSHLIFGTQTLKPVIVPFFQQD